MNDRKIGVRIDSRRAAMFLSFIFLSTPYAGLPTGGPRNMCDSEKTMAEAIECWQALAIVPAEQSTAHHCARPPIASIAETHRPINRHFYSVQP